MTSLDNKNISILLILFLSVTTIWNFTIAQESDRSSRSIESTTRKYGTTQRLIGGHLNNVDDTESLRMESSGNKQKKQKEDSDDEDKKTLSQQVAEGKYGLIQKELFSEPAKKLGILSYNPNPDVPKDTIKTLGGLTNDDIWLAEDHLLILKGGIFPGHNTKTNVNWPPIDNYKAPRRQVKIPPNPKIPPPFPVQLSDDGPIELIGPNGTIRTLPKGTNSVYPQEGYIPGTGPFFPEKANETPFPIPAYIPGKNFSKGSGKLPPFPLPGVGVRPFISSLPPNAVYLPPPTNQTDIYDEDDPSIYYPPPYSFYYSKDNDTEIPAGPLVPGIILPPPPDFFGQLEPTTKRYPKVNRTRLTSIRPTIKVYTTQIVPTTVADVTTTPKPIYVEDVTTPKPIYVEDVPDKIRLHIPYDDITSDIPDNNLNLVTTPIPIVTTTPPKRIKLYPQTTTPSYYPDYDNTILNNVKPVYGPPKHRVRVSTTAVPLKAFFTTNAEIESNSVTNDYKPRNTVRASPKFKPSAQFYYYEEPKTTTDRPFVRYYTTPKPIYQEEYQKPESINTQILRLRQELESYLTSPRYKIPSTTSKPVYEYSFQAAGYVSKNGGASQDQYRSISGYDPIPTVTPLYNPQPIVSTPIYKTSTPVYPKTYDYDYQQPKSQYYTTESPHAYYTKQDERLFDDITKQYFTVFGQKITGGGRLQSTTPLNSVPSTTDAPQYVSTVSPKYNTQFIPVAPKVEVNFGDNSQVVRTEGRGHKKKIVSLAGDILVNYRNPRPLINPDAEFIPEIVARPITLSQRLQPQQQRPISLESDINVNFKHPRPQVNPNAEFIQPVKVNPQYQRPPNAEPIDQYQQRPANAESLEQYDDYNSNQQVTYVQPVKASVRNRYRDYQYQNEGIKIGEGRPGSFISFPLPGNGAHFYFLTPQVSLQHKQDDYLYPEPNQRLRRRSRHRHRTNEQYRSVRR